MQFPKAQNAFDLNVASDLQVNSKSFTKRLPMTKYGFSLFIYFLCFRRLRFAFPEIDFNVVIQKLAKK